MNNIMLEKNNHMDAVVYGIQIKPDNCGSPMSYPYISPSRADVERLIKQMQCAESLSNDHIRDIITDELYRLYSEQLRINGLAY